MKARSGIATVTVLALAAGALAACVPEGPPGGGGGGGGGNGGGAAGGGYVSRRYMDERLDEYLAYATQVFAPGNAENVIAHLERRERDPGYEFPDEQVTAEAFAPSFAKIDAMLDTADFDMMYLLDLWYSFRDELDPGLVDAMEQRFLDFKYWYTEPNPPGIIDNKGYWSENHRLIYHVIEYLAGQAFPNATFTNDGRTGRQHMAHARTLIDEWVAERAKFGFFEWHSNVYYLKDVFPLALLAERAHDHDVARQASMVLDLVLLDVALHLQNGAFGATHGRTYMKDLHTALVEDTWGFQKLLWDDTDQPYNSSSDSGALILGRAHRYRVPEVIRRIGRSRAVGVDRERMGIVHDPLAPVVPDPVAPYGLDYDDPDLVPLWWSMGAYTTWQAVALTLATADQYGLWETDQFQPFVPLRDLTGGDVDVARSLAQALAPMIALGLLPEVNTYTWRSPEVMLSTAQDHRPGQYAEQVLAWQATLDAGAFVFTTGPTDPVTESPLLEWPDGDGYWTGTVLPRSAQHERVGIHLYAPQYADPGPGVLEDFAYEPYTHAFFPQERFDEVVRRGNWTIGRRAGGYVALYSWRPPQWQVYDPAVLARRGFTQSFDLVAPGGADNVWIVEVGRAAEWPSFGAFADAIAAAPVTVTPRGSAGGVSKGFDVRYTSPGEGVVEFGWTGPLRVGGEEVPISGYPRMENRWTEVPHLGRVVDVRDGHHRLRLDFTRGKRLVTGA